MNKHCLGKFHYLFYLMVFSFLTVMVQGQVYYNTTNWRFSNPKQFGFTVTDLDFFDDNTALAVGGDGGVARTIDGGTNWIYGVLTFTNAAGLVTKQSINDVHFITSQQAYLVGNAGLMAKTNDGGVTWSFVNTPFFSLSKNINAVWFTDANTGYIGGQFLATDSIPKLYRTTNGGATWDSIAAPLGGKTRVGYINNPNIPSAIWDFDAKGKEIYRIEFSSPNLGYITGGGSSLFPRVSNNASSTTCLPLTGNLTTSANNAALVWKYSNGTLTDYSLSKERLGYSGILTNTITCTTSYNAAQITPVPQQYRAINIINDSLLLVMSFNNNCVLRINTGRNDSTVNLATGLKENGRYEIMNFPFPPTQGPEAGSPIPNPQVLVASNPYYMRRAANGKLYATGNFGRLWTSVDTGRNWVQENCLPANQTYSAYGTWALDITPSGRFVVMGTNGVTADSVSGTPWKSNYQLDVSAAYTKIEFADCNNGMATGGGSIAITNDGGKTWMDRTRQDFVNLFININSFGYVNGDPAKAYFATSVGNIYKSVDMNVVPPATPTMDPVYSNSNWQLFDIATAGTDSVWACGYSSFSVPTASRTPVILSSFDGGNSWTPYTNFFPGSLFQNFRFIEFPTRMIGYVAGTRDTIWKTTDAGVTWNKLPLPTPGVTPQITYTDMFALDANTVFLVGNGFPRKVVFRTTDGGNTWTDITNNIPTLGGGNLNGVLFHDINNGYVVSPGGFMYVTNDGGASWSLDIGPTSLLLNSLAFAPKTVQPSVPFQNRRLFTVGAAGPNIFGHIMEYGNPANLNVSSTEVVANASCTNINGGSVTINATGGIAPYTYSIDGGAFQSSNMFSGLTQGTKTITIKDSYCGTLTKTVNVGFTDNLVLTASNDTTVCAGASFTLFAATNGTGATFNWTPTAGLSNANISNPVATITAPVTYTVNASLNGCVRTEPVVIGIKPSPVISAGPDKTIGEGDQVTLDGSTNNINITSIAWTPSASLNYSNILTPVAKPQTTTTYTLTIKNSDNCISTDNVVVTVLPNCISVMNAFTPNNDGFNDRWLVTKGNTCTTRVKAVVYNRYGEEVYHEENYQNNWDGTYKGKPVPDGTYYYAVTYYMIGGKVATMKGDVTILR